MNRKTFKRTFREFVFGEDFRSWYVPEVSKLKLLLNREIRNGFLQAAESVKAGMSTDEAWEAFSELHSKKHSEYAGRIAEAERLHLIIPFYSSNVLKRMFLKLFSGKYASLSL